MTANSLSQEFAAKKSRRIDLDRSVGKVRTAANSIGVDLFFAYDDLMREMRAFSQANGTASLVSGSGAYRTATFYLNVVVRELAAMKNFNPAGFEALRSGMLGRYYAFKCTNTGGAKCLFFDENGREALENGPKHKNGMPAALDNAARNLRNQRRAITEVWETAHGKSTGFPFFGWWDRLNALGEVDAKGRSGLVGHLDLRWVFGAEWAAETFPQNAENQPQATTTTENFSANTINLKDLLEEEVNDVAFSYVEPVKSVSAKPTNVGTQTGADQSINNFSGAGSRENAPDAPPSEAGAANAAPQETPTAAVAAVSTSNLEAATQLWHYLLEVLYLPILAAGRVRLAANVVAGTFQFAEKWQEEAVKMCLRNLMALKTEVIGLQDALEMAKSAVEKQAEYLQKHEAAWVMPPNGFLDCQKPHGTLLAAVRIFGNVEQVPPAKPVQDVPGTFRHKSNALWNRLVKAGAKTTRKWVFDRWCRKYGLEHIELCLDRLAEVARERRGPAGKAGQEFDHRKGGASAYFAGLITGYDTSGTIAAARNRTMRATVAYVGTLWQRKNEWPEDSQEKIYLLTVYDLYLAMAKTPEKYQAWQEKTVEYFNLTECVANIRTAALMLEYAKFDPEIAVKYQ